MKFMILMNLAETNNLLLGALPESLGLLAFGIGLVVFAVVLRRFFGAREAAAQNNLEKTIG